MEKKKKGGVLLDKQRFRDGQRTSQQAYSRGDQICDRSRLAINSRTWWSVRAQLWCPEQSQRAASSAFFRHHATRTTTRNISGDASIGVRIELVARYNKFMSHEFTLVLTAAEVTDDQVNALYEAGLDDGTVSTSGGITRIRRSGTTLIRWNRRSARQLVR